MQRVIKNLSQHPLDLIDLNIPTEISVPAQRHESVQNVLVDLINDPVLLLYLQPQKVVKAYLTLSLYIDV